MFFGLNCQAQEKLSLPQAIELALEKNIDLQETRKDLLIAKNNVKVANKLLNPAFYNFYNIGPVSKGNPQQIGILQFIEIAKRGPRKKLAEANVLLTEEILKLCEFDLRMNVRQSYVELVYAKSFLKMLEMEKALLEKMVYITKMRVAVGASAEIDIMEAKVVLNQLNVQINIAKSKLLSAKFKFNATLNIKGNNDRNYYDTDEDELPDDRVVGKNFGDFLTPNPRNPMLNFEKAVDMAYKSRYDLKIAQKEINVAEKNLVTVIRKRIPDIEVSAGYSYITAENNPPDNTFLNGAYAEFAILNIPILYNYSPEIKNAKLELEQAKLHYDSVKNLAITKLQAAYEKFEIASQNLNFYNDELLNDSGELVKLAMLSYEVGKSNLTTLIVMQQAYLGILTGYIQALGEYYDCWVEFIKQLNCEETMEAMEK